MSKKFLFLTSTLITRIAEQFNMTAEEVLEHAEPFNPIVVPDGSNETYIRIDPDSTATTSIIIENVEPFMKDLPEREPESFFEKKMKQQRRKRCLAKTKKR